jgi:hypothetical protein
LLRAEEQHSSRVGVGGSMEQHERSTSALLANSWRRRCWNAPPTGAASWSRYCPSWSNTSAPGQCRPLIHLRVAARAPIDGS